MTSSNSDNLSQPHSITNDDWDWVFSNWDLDLSMWDLFHEDGQIYDDLFLINNPASAQCPDFDYATESLNVAGQAEQNMSLNELETIMPESLDIAEMLAQDPDLDPFLPTHDLPLEPPVVSLPLQPFTPDGFERTLEQAPPPPRNDPSPDDMSLVVPSWLDRQITTDDLYHRTQADPKPADSSTMSEKDITFKIGQSLVGSTLTTLQEPRRSKVYPGESTWTSRSAEPSRCAPCRFANIPTSQCNGSVGSTCTRCERLRSKVDKKLANTQSSLKFSLSPSAPMISLPQVIYFELVETQKLLVDLRGEVDEISSFTPGNSLESLFDGNMLWHIDNKAIFSPYSKSISTVAVTRLMTARAEMAAPPDCIVAPAMDAVHLDTFIDQRRPARETKGLTDINVGIPTPLSLCQVSDVPQRETLTIAWRCAYWLTILLSWDSNELYVNQAGHDALPLVDAKNLVLELTYSIAHRIQVLIKKLCHRAAKSLNRLDESLDPEDAKKPKATITFAAERHVSDPFFMGGGGVFDSGLQPQSFSDILKSEIPFQDDIDLFLGRPATRNLAALRPSDRASLISGELPRGHDFASTSTTAPLTFPSWSDLSYASSIDTAQLNDFEVRKRALSDEGTSCSRCNAKRIR
ncbi:uncharacterized protein FIESC28_02332 [Fusarium coffeatum]|uniref:Uncharacterized protein n=1 Tax=Fusarium coffeatum TaxID=231269 RepID=A0A366S6G8_9HYPO|nr:uncharacterized protein FIESC28_02332 [Fusarium coffeatum]RBR24914.1 hypothetical protein FIESC28_02332 [Fusarium coffeatum]